MQIDLPGAQAKNSNLTQMKYFSKAKLSENIFAWVRFEFLGKEFLRGSGGEALDSVSEH